ncbi:MAG: hypothetical protein KDA86_11760 [Planctomycetaceae bacterium]|nr:hypothetical protein [Planctomycetaceae bacterium]
MQRRHILRLLVSLPVVLASAGWSSDAPAQVTRGFDTVARAIATGEERQRQPDLRVFEVQYKLPRIVWVDITDPKTGQQQREQIWYLAYRTANRVLANREDDTNTTPVNVLDPLPGPTQFIPEFTLTTYDQQGSEQYLEQYLDVILPEATAVINTIERRRPSDPVFLDSVNIVQSLPPAVPSDAEDVDWIYGVATWRNVDPETDFFTISMRGFSNGYELKAGPDGETVTWRNTLVQQVSRRGDRFDPDQIEFEYTEPPEWVYLPDLPPGESENL